MNRRRLLAAIVSAVMAATMMPAASFGEEKAKITIMLTISFWLYMTKSQTAHRDWIVLISQKVKLNRAGELTSWRTALLNSCLKMQTYLWMEGSLSQGAPHLKVQCSGWNLIRSRT